MRRTRRILTLCLLVVGILMTGRALFETGTWPTRIAGARTTRQSAHSAIDPPARAHDQKVQAKHRYGTNRPPDQPGEPLGSQSLTQDEATSDTQIEIDGPSEQRDPSRLWPYLDATVVRSERLTTRIAGWDPLGDRTIILWRRKNEAAEPIARTHSQADGRFDFGHIPAPNADFQLVVTTQTGDPLSPAPRAATRPVLPPPHAEVYSEADGIHLVLYPAVLGGELWITDENAVMVRRIPVTRSPHTIVLDDGAPVHARAFVQVLPDGRRSAPVPIGLASTSAVAAQ